MTFELKTAPAIVHRAVCGYRNEQEKMFEKLFYAPNSKGRIIWDRFDGREALRKINTAATDVTQSDSYKAWFDKGLPAKGFLNFHNMCFRWSEYLECQTLIFPADETFKNQLAVVRAWMEEVKERVEREEEENEAWAETREAEAFQRNAYGND